MSTHYVINHDFDIVAAYYAVTTSSVDGNFVMKVDENMPLLAEPETASSVASLKAESLLAFYSTFSTAIYNGGLTSGGVDIANSTGVHSGGRGCTKLYDTGVLQTDAVTILPTPSIAVVSWDVFRYTTTDEADSRLTRICEDQASSLFTAEVSFNGGSTWTACTDLVPVTIAAPDQGTDVVLRFTNTTTPRWLGFWAVLY